MQFRRFICCLAVLLTAVSIFGQQTGSISGKVTADGAGLPGVTVEAASNALPQPRVTVSDVNGDYRLPALQPGSYTVTFSLSGMQTVTRRAEVLLGQTTYADAALGVAALAETITVSAEASLVDRESTELKSGLSNDQIHTLPITQEYRDLQKLVPGVAVTQDTVRGPSSGGSGQDNVYLFDGVNVTMPLFGVLVAEPATHDVAQVNVVKGGARAVDFQRSGGFEIDSVSKSGTNEFSGQVSYQILNNSFVADRTEASNSQFDQDRTWGTANIGGPILPDRLFFYGSYYRPEFTKDNASNLYGELPSFKLERNEYFGKLTATPTASLLLNGSYRDSNRKETGSEYASTSAGTIGIGYETDLKIATLEGSWVINPNSFATFKYTDFRNPGGGRADNLADVQASFAPGTRLDLANLDRIGQLTVPTAIAGNAAQNAFVQQFIDRYGYIQNGVRTGGGTVGVGRFAEDNDDFFRKGGQIGFNYVLGSRITHDLHFGYQRTIDEEDRFQTANGFGLITIPGGTVNCPVPACPTATPAFFQAQVSQQTGSIGVPTIHSEFHSQNIELNDSIRMNNWTFNVGVLLSEDTLYGQGLREADNVAGFVNSPGTKYKMHETPFEDMIQPRLGSTWAYNGSDTVFVSFARYNPAANSDARAASYDRNLVRDLTVYFDREGVLLGVSPVASSSGKLFQEDIQPRQTFEYTIGTAQQITPNWSARVYGRHRKSDRFWEDVNNNARIRFGSQVPGVRQELYIPNLDDLRRAIGSGNLANGGSTYVIAELDGAFTKYYEVSTESDYRRGNAYVKGSYTWSHYYGNFDQDNSSFNTANDAAIFIGSSNIGDGAGRQLWDFKYGDLRGDRRHVGKLYGSYTLPWRATAGLFGVYQSGQPYQLESFLPYGPLGQNLTTNQSDTNRYAEPAGRRRGPAHHQVDLNYTQNFPLPAGLNLQVGVDLFNLYDKQTGYDFETRVGSLGFRPASDPDTIEVPVTIPLPSNVTAGSRIRKPFAKSFYEPRRFQVAVRLQF
jgi:hypothetical protein